MTENLYEGKFHAVVSQDIFREVLFAPCGLAICSLPVTFTSFSLYIGSRVFESNFSWMK